MSSLTRFAWLTLAYNVAVILWGAYVRATGSGAGCGSHWPLCNGEVVPRAGSAETLIEFSHRLTSGLAVVVILALCWWVHRTFVAGHPARRGAQWSVAFILVEAAVGAGLVLFELVGDTATTARAIVVAIHLANTLLLLGALTLTAHWTDAGAPLSTSAQPVTALAIISVGVGLVIAGASGAVTALGDTLFPAASLPDALAAELSTGSPFLVRLRVFHPAIALAVATPLVLGRHLYLSRVPKDDGQGRRAGRALVGLVLVQVAMGALNVLLLAPVWLQLVHLLIADLLWIAFVLLGASLLADQPDAAAERRPGGTVAAH